LLDQTRNLVFNGLSGFGDSPAAIAAYLERFCARQGYQHLIDVGTSGGSRAVLHLGISGNFDVVAPVAYASIGKHPEWRPLFEEVTASHDPDKTPIRVTYRRRAVTVPAQTRSPITCLLPSKYATLRLARLFSPMRRTAES